jgi:hypothetical protein
MLDIRTLFELEDCANDYYYFLISESDIYDSPIIEVAESVVVECVGMFLGRNLVADMELGDNFEYTGVIILNFS